MVACGWMEYGVEVGAMVATGIPLALPLLSQLRRSNNNTTPVFLSYGTERIETLPISVPPNKTGANFVPPGGILLNLKSPLRIRHKSSVAALLLFMQVASIV